MISYSLIRNDEIKSIEVFNSAGMKMNDLKFNPDSYREAGVTLELNVAELTYGFYFVSAITQSGNIFREKFIIAK